MKVLDLFSGIGGFSLGLERAGMKTIAFCEKDKFCQKVLKKHWPDVTIFEDITKLKGEMINETIDLVCGGVPCQPASVAGKRKGTKDDRWLWGETYRIVREVKPQWVLLENVKGILSLEQGVVFENLLLELESYGYETASFIIPACAVNAPHRRDRVWIIANTTIEGWQGNRIKGEGQLGFCVRARKGETLQKLNMEQWSENWIEAAAGLCRVDAGVPRKLDKDRINRLKCLGNSVVPQIVEIIGRYILTI